MVGLTNLAIGVGAVIVVTIIAKYIAKNKHVVTVIKLLNNFKAILQTALPDKYEVVFDILYDLSKYISDSVMTKEEAIEYANKEIEIVLKKQFDIVLSEDEKKIVAAVVTAIVELVYRDKKASAAAIKILSEEPIKAAKIMCK